MSIRDRIEKKEPTANVSARIPESLRNETSKELERIGQSWVWLMESACKELLEKNPDTRKKK